MKEGFLSIPVNVFQHLIVPYFELSDVQGVARTCKTLYGWIKKTTVYELCCIIACCRGKWEKVAFQVGMSNNLTLICCFRRHVFQNARYWDLQSFHLNIHSRVVHGSLLNRNNNVTKQASQIMRCAKILYFPLLPAIVHDNAEIMVYFAQQTESPFDLFSHARFACEHEAISCLSAMWNNSNLFQVLEPRVNTWFRIFNRVLGVGNKKVLKWCMKTFDFDTGLVYEYHCAKTDHSTLNIRNILTFCCLAHVSSDDTMIRMIAEYIDFYNDSFALIRQAKRNKFIWESFLQCSSLFFLESNQACFTERRYTVNFKVYERVLASKRKKRKVSV